MIAEISSSSFWASAFDTAPLAAARSAGAIGVVESVADPVVPVGLLGSVALEAGGGVAGGGVAGAGVAAGGVEAGGFAGLAVGLLGGIGSAAGSGVVAPPAAFENSARCVRNSVSFARIAGSSCALPVVPLVPTAPVVPLPLVPAGAGVGFVPAGAEGSAPMSAVRFASTLANDARHSVCVVISSLKFEISCDTCVRASPCSFAASGIDVSCASDSRAAVRCAFAAVTSGCPAGGAVGCGSIVGGGVVGGGVVGGCVVGGCVVGGCVVGGCVVGGCVVGGCVAGGCCGAAWVCCDGEVDCVGVCADAAMGRAISAAAATVVVHRAVERRIREALLDVNLRFMTREVIEQARYHADLDCIWRDFLQPRCAAGWKFLPTRGRQCCRRAAASPVLSVAIVPGGMSR